MSKKEEKKGKVYLVVPGEGGPDSSMSMGDDSNKDQGIRENFDKVKAIFGWRDEVEADASDVEDQINNYVTIIKGVASKEEEKDDSIKLSEISLSLTLSAKGNIGIASTSAEAGIKLVFKRS